MAESGRELAPYHQDLNRFAHFSNLLAKEFCDAKADAFAISMPTTLSVRLANVLLLVVFVARQ